MKSAKQIRNELFQDEELTRIQNVITFFERVIRDEFENETDEGTISNVKEIVLPEYVTYPMLLQIKSIVKKAGYEFTHTKDENKYVVRIIMRGV